MLPAPSAVTYLYLPHTRSKFLSTKIHFLPAAVRARISFSPARHRRESGCHPAAVCFHSLQPCSRQHNPAQMLGKFLREVSRLLYTLVTSASFNFRNCSSFSRPKGTQTETPTFSLISRTASHISSTSQNPRYHLFIDIQKPTFLVFSRSVGL